MTNKKIYGEIKEIEFESVKELYNARAKAIDSSLHAIMLQDKDSDLPLRRNDYEKNSIFPKLLINQDSKVLDLGCGPGRIAKLLPSNIHYYYGLDFSEEFISIAKKELKNCSNFFFLNTDFSDIDSCQELKSKAFNLIFSAGATIYLNDSAVTKLFNDLLTYVENTGHTQIYVRESISMLDHRITLDNIYSEKLKAHYSSIYRTDKEYKDLFKIFEARSFYLAEEGLFPESLANNNETRQKFYIIKRG